MTPPSRYALRSTRVVLPDGVRPATLLVDEGRVAAVGEGDVAFERAEVSDFGELVVGPGLVDAHVHVNQPGRTEWEGFQSATAAAAAGGVTTLIDMPLNSSPVTTSVDALFAKRAAAEGQCWVDVAFYGGLVHGNADQVATLVEAGVAGIKAFLCDSGLDEFPPAHEADLIRAAARLAELGAPLLVHAELPLTPGPTVGDPRRYADYLASRPKAWETAAIELLIRVCRATGCRTHIVHLANSDSLATISRARAEGLPLTVETCPHYLHFAAEQVPDGDTRFKCAPPIREAPHREQLWEGLRNGVIDTVGSDHSPCPPEMKELETGDFLRAWGGVAGLELTLPVVATGAAQREIALEEVFRWTSQRPAELFGLGHRKGKIAGGFDADFVVFDPRHSWTVEGVRLRHRHKITPYDGQRLTGRVETTIRGGRCVFADGEVLGPPGGTLLQSIFDGNATA